MKLKDKVAIVTGATSGIGEATAIMFAAEGAKVACVGSSDIDKAAAVARRIADAGGVAKPYVCNLREIGQIDGFVKTVVDDFGTVDILVNSAGVFYPTPVGETTEEQYDLTMDVNVKGMFFLIGAVAPIMKAKKSGKIINLSSVLAQMAFGGYPVYCASKAAVCMMTRSMALALAPYDINVNAILPGNTATPMNYDLRTKPEFKGYIDMTNERTPSNQAYSDPEDMAAAALYLASAESRAMHGGLMVLDEGFSLGM